MAEEYSDIEMTIKFNAPKLDGGYAPTLIDNSVKIVRNNGDIIYKGSGAIQISETIQEPLKGKALYDFIASYNQQIAELVRQTILNNTDDKIDIGVDE